LSYEWSTLFSKGIIAGWLVASMVWLIHAARDSVSRFFTVFFIMFLIPSLDLYHCIVGACEVFYLAFEGHTSFVDAVLQFFVPVTLGNTVGGVLLVAILNYGQTRDAVVPQHDTEREMLSMREWLFGMHTGEYYEKIRPHR
jgi:formate/nitrite transporter FocA (FNT family)